MPFFVSTNLSSPLCRYSNAEAEIEVFGQALIRLNKPGFPRQPEADPSEAFGGCAGMTSRGMDPVEKTPSFFML